MTEITHRLLNSIDKVTNKCLMWQKIFYFICCCQSSCFVTNPCSAFLLALTVHWPHFPSPKDLRSCLLWTLNTLSLCLKPYSCRQYSPLNVGNTVHCHIVQRVKNRISTKHKSQWKFFLCNYVTASPSFLLYSQHSLC